MEGERSSSPAPWSSAGRSGIDWDRYGRAVGWVYVRDDDGRGICVNRQLVGAIDHVTPVAAFTLLSSDPAAEDQGVRSHLAQMIDSS